MTLIELLNWIKQQEMQSDNDFQKSFQESLKEAEKEALLIIQSLVATSNYHGVASIDKFYEKLFNESIDEIDRHLERSRQDSFLMFLWLCQLMKGSFRVATETSVPDMNWHTDGTSFKESIETIKKRIIGTTETEIKRSRVLKREPQLSFRGTETGFTRLIETESVYVERQAHRQAAESEDFKRYMYIATLDNLTCDECGDLDAKVFYYKDAEAGVNFPPMHPNCRCTDIPYFPEWRNRRAAREYISHPIEVRMNYDRWLKIYGEESRKNLFVSNTLKGVTGGNK